MEIEEMLVRDFFALHEEEEEVPAGELYSFLVRHNADPRQITDETVRKCGREYDANDDAFVKTERD